MSCDFRIGTRRSKLAKWQANYSKWLIEEANPGKTCEIVEIETEADIQKDKPLYEMGGKAAFVKELEQSLIDKKIDVAVHSVKDMPAVLPENLLLTAVLERGDPRDVIIARGPISVLELKAGTKVGTSSLRRMAQLRAVNPSIQIVPIRGNLETRIQKVDRGEVDAVVVSAAAILRISLESRISQYLDSKIMLPAPGQGAIGLECRAEDMPVLEAVRKVNHTASMTCILAERAFMRHLGANCHVPVACLAGMTTHEVPMIQMQGLIASVNGTSLLLERAVFPDYQAEALGQYLALRLIAQGGRKILDDVQNNPSGV